MKPVRRLYLEQELLEVSAVGIPANPNALALGLKNGAIEKSDLKDLLSRVDSSLKQNPLKSSSSSSGVTLGVEHPLSASGGEGRGEVVSFLSSLEQQEANEFRSSMAGPGPNTSALGTVAGEAQLRTRERARQSALLQLARDIREVLRKA